MKELLPQLLLITAPVFMAALAWLSLKAAALINANTKNAYLKGVMLRLNDATLTAVREVQQVYVSNLSNGGALSTAQQLHAKAAAIESVKSHLGSRGLVEMSHILGLDGTGVEKFLAAKVEATVSEIKDLAVRPVVAAIVPAEVVAAKAEVAEAWIRGTVPAPFR